MPATVVLPTPPFPANAIENVIYSYPLFYSVVIDSSRFPVKGNPEKVKQPSALRQGTILVDPILNLTLNTLIHVLGGQIQGK
jgi:hypothetical protein